jgi:pimeloyl-ACP methyl ester carboxylesterase
MDQIRETDVTLDDGRVLHAYETVSPDGSSPGGRVPVFWQHGTPNTGAPPLPLFAAAAGSGLRWISYDRPGYNGSSPDPGRTFASAAADTAAVADALGLGRFAVMGHSSGGPNALACAALLSDRVFAVVSVSGLAPHPAGGGQGWWFEGMHPGGAARLQAARTSRAALVTNIASEGFDPESFTPEDWAALNGDWKWFDTVVGPALDSGPGGLIEDELANAGPWGFDPRDIAVPVLLLHGDADRIVPSSHSEWLARAIPGAVLRIIKGEGHISALRRAPDALAWLGEVRTAQRR